MDWESRQRFTGICIITEDMMSLREFYRNLLQLESAGEDPFGPLPIAGADLSFFDKKGMERMAPGSMQGAGHGSYTLEFEVEDVDQQYERLVGMNVPIVKPPETHPWGRRSFWFRDPDGNIVVFYTPVASSQ